GGRRRPAPPRPPIRGTRPEPEPPPPPCRLTSLMLTTRPVEPGGGVALLAVWTKPGCTPLDAHAPTTAASASGSRMERTDLPRMEIPSRYNHCTSRISTKMGQALISFVDPGGLDGFEDLLVGTARIVLEIGQFQHPAVQVGEAKIDVVGLGMALFQLNRDVLDVGPAQFAGHLASPTCRPSCSGSPAAA